MKAHDATESAPAVSAASSEIYMRRRDLLTRSAAMVVASMLPGGAAAGALTQRKPNFIVILTDDLGYGDVGAFGGRIATPAIDRMARQGVRLTDYYAPANVCTPSRAGLLTGRYPIRTGLGYEVITVNDDRGLPLSELTIAEALKPEYATALIGKWHLGHVAPYWPPTRHGFDLFYGIPYSHDMKPLAMFEAHGNSEEIKESEAIVTRLQQDFAARAEQFISDNRDRPFFLELALSAPHLPNARADSFKGRSNFGPFGDVVEEVDSIVGRILAKVKALGLDQDTLVILTSDNGPWFEGSSGNLRERKGGAGYDGGYRVPFIARWPGKLPAGRRINAIAMGIDILPTLCSFAGKPLPSSLQLDGRDIGAVLKAGAPSPHEQLALFDNEDVVAIRTQRWKYVASAYYRGLKFPLARTGMDELFDMSADPTESYNVAETYPAVFEEMKIRYERARDTFRALSHKEVPKAFRNLPDILQDAQE